MEPAVEVSWLFPLRASLDVHDELPASTRVVMRSPKLRAGDFLLTRLGILRGHGDLDDPDELFKRLRRSTAAAVQRDSLEAAVHSRRPRVLMDGAKVVGVVPPTKAGQASAYQTPKAHRVLREPLARPGRSVFRAFCRVDAPDVMKPSSSFPVEVGFSLDGIDPVETTDEETATSVTFDLIAVGYLLDFPEGASRRLTVPREDPQSVTTTFTVQAQNVSDADATLTVLYLRRGVLCGNSTHAVRISADGTPGPRPTGIQPAIVHATTRDVAPDLTVVIDLTPDGWATWSFCSPYEDLTLPGEARAHFGQGGDQFVTSIFGGLDMSDDDSAMPPLDDLRGLSRFVADRMPPEFWAALEALWRRSGANLAGGAPTLLFISSEPYVPWHLAWVDERTHPSLLPAGRRGSPLAALMSVGRWFVNHAESGPSSPIPSQVSRKQMVAVTGGYKGPGRDSLPDALKECRELARDYKGVMLNSPGGLHQLLEGKVTRGRDQQQLTPTLVHIAMHGAEPNALQPLRTRLEPEGGFGIRPLTLMGAKLLNTASPMVFLNACFVGQEGTVLGSPVGLPSAFIMRGVPAVIAPLWTVDDEVASRFALAFYRLTIDEGLTVGEALRRLRDDPDGPPATESDWSRTSLAYVLFGQPGLRILPKRRQRSKP